MTPSHPRHTGRTLCALCSTASPATTSKFVPCSHYRAAITDPQSPCANKCCATLSHPSFTFRTQAKSRSTCSHCLLNKAGTKDGCGWGYVQKALSRLCSCSWLMFLLHDMTWTDYGGPESSYITYELCRLEQDRENSVEQKWYGGTSVMLVTESWCSLRRFGRGEAHGMVWLWLFFGNILCW